MTNESGGGGEVRARRGFALIIVLFVLAVMAASVAGYFAVTTSSARASASLIERRRAFYMCDGVSRAVAQLAQQYIIEVPGAVPSGMKAYVCDKGGSTGCPGAPHIPTLVEPGFTVNTFELDPLASSPSVGLITEGPLTGMQANQLPIRVLLEIERTASGATCELDQEIMLGSVSMFQFFLFSEDDVSWVPAPASVIRGPVHVNGDLCISGHTGMAMERVQATGGILSHQSAGNCGVSTGSKVCVWNGTGAMPTLASIAGWPIGNCPPITTANDSASGSWSAATWNNRALDGTNNVGELKLPVASVAQVQASLEADGTTAYANDDSSRLLVDPVRPADNNDVRAQKLACKADLRIINGVWYLRDDPNPTSDPCGGWPGTPIWSDHPGSFSVSGANEPNERLLLGSDMDVGQEDIAGYRNWNLVPNAEQTPRRYSPFRFDRTPGAATLVKPDPPTGGAEPGRPIVTYGPVGKSGGRVVNAHWLDNGQANQACQATSVGATPTLVTVEAGNVGPGNECAEGFDAAYLNASRQGFMDPQVYKYSAGTAAEREARARIRPMNFDVEALRAALKDCNHGELGAYFPGTCSGVGRRFNGIIYITHTWDKSLDGFGAAAPAAGGAAVWPSQGVNADPAQPNRTSNWGVASGGSNTPALPYPLCTRDADHVGEPMVDGGATQKFVVPHCNLSNGEVGARPQAVRIINAEKVGDSTLSTDPLVKGLTIATNVPLYVQGDVNTFSDPSTATATPWVPFLVAGDHVRLFSKAWTDAWVPWDDVDRSDHDGSDNSAPQIGRQAVDTTYNMQILAGHPVTSPGDYSGGIENFPGFYEDWDGIRAEINGAFVRGYSPVYLRWVQGGYKRPPDRPWTFDPHLASTSNQPPGAPRYDVQAVRIWRRN